MATPWVRQATKRRQGATATDWQAASLAHCPQRPGWGACMHEWRPRLHQATQAAIAALQGGTATSGQASGVMEWTRFCDGHCGGCDASHGGWLQTFARRGPQSTSGTATGEPGVGVGQARHTCVMWMGWLCVSIRAARLAGVHKGCGKGKCDHGGARGRRRCMHRSMHGARGHSKASAFDGATKLVMFGHRRRRRRRRRWLALALRRSLTHTCSPARVPVLALGWGLGASGRALRCAPCPVRHPFHT